MTEKNSLFSIDDVIYSYTGKEAIADGLQILIDRDLSDQCGINFPAYFTQGVWNSTLNLCQKIRARTKPEE